MKINKKKKP